MRIDSLGDRIKLVRKEKGLTQADFASKLSISRPFVSQIESGKENPSDSIIKLISETYNINFQWLKEGSGNKYKDINAFTVSNPDLIEKSGLQGTASLEFAQCSGILLRIISNTNIKDDSDEYYLSQIRSILFSLDHLLSLDEESLHDWSFYESITKHINQHIYDALEALKYDGLNKKLVSHIAESESE